MASTDRSKANKKEDIWSSRIQRELLALSTAEERSTLPPVVTVREHTLDLSAGQALLLFDVEILKVNTLNLVLDASNTSSKKCYPFAPPSVQLQGQSQPLPEGSTLDIGDCIDISDLDWTPSLHMRDAMTHVALQIKESILQGEPLLGIKEQTSPTSRLAQSLQKGATTIGKALKTSPKKKKKKPPATSAATPGVAMGDEINVLQEPWVDARGVYSCKATQRPDFIQELMMQNDDNTGTSMFRSLTESARSIMEESFLMITDTHILELKASKLQPSQCTVTFCMPIELLAKLKFRRHESISLFFKTDPKHALIYTCRDAGDAVQQIQAVLKQHGVRGKHTNAAAFKTIQQAMGLVQEIQTKELALHHDPTVERVNNIMDLYRQAAERFESAGDLRHAEVMAHMRKFLALPQTMAILDGTFEKKETPPSSSPQGEVLQSPSHELDDDIALKEKEKDKEFAENVDNLLKEVQQDLGGSFEDTVDTAMDDSGGLADVAADLDAMMRETDKELAELMKD